MGYIENVTDVCAIETLEKGIGSIAMSLKMLIFVVIYCEYTLLILLPVDNENNDVYVDHRKNLDRLNACRSFMYFLHTS